MPGQNHRQGTVVRQPGHHRHLTNHFRCHLVRRSFAQLDDELIAGPAWHSQEYLPRAHRKI